MVWSFTGGRPKGAERRNMANELALHEGSKWRDDGSVIDSEGSTVGVWQEGEADPVLVTATGEAIEGNLTWAVDAHAVLERAGHCPHAPKPGRLTEGESRAPRTVRLTDDEFQALMVLMMVEDSLTVLAEEKAILVRTLNTEATARGHSNWIAAYHANWGK
jgi:hypothetical protein